MNIREKFRNLVGGQSPFWFPAISLKWRTILLLGVSASAIIFALQLAVKVAADTTQGEDALALGLALACCIITWRLVKVLGCLFETKLSDDKLHKTWANATLPARLLALTMAGIMVAAQHPRKPLENILPEWEAAFIAFISFGLLLQVVTTGRTDHTTLWKVAFPQADTTD